MARVLNASIAVVIGGGLWFFVVGLFPTHQTSSNGWLASFGI